MAARPSSRPARAGSHFPAALPIALALIAAEIVCLRFGWKLWIPPTALGAVGLVFEAIWMERRRGALADAGQRWGGLVAGVRFQWLVETRKHELLKQWPKACHTHNIVTKGKDKQYPYLRKLKANVNGDISTSVFPGKMGINMNGLIANAPLLAEIMGCRSMTVRRFGIGNAELTMLWSDPLSRVIDLGNLPKSGTGLVSYGLLSSGKPATIRQDLGLLIGGLTGRGKSNIIHTLVSDLVRSDVPIRLYVSDPKGGTELKMYNSYAGEQKGLLKVQKYVKSAAETIEMVTDLEKRMRFSQSKQEGRKHVPTQENPLNILILDELLPLHEMLKKGTASPLGALMYEGRGSGYVVWCNAQTGHADAIGRLRELIPQRICLGTKTSQTTDTVLGDGATQRGADCRKLAPGIGYAETADDDDSADYLKFRAPLVTDEDIESIVAGNVPAAMDRKAAQPLFAKHGLYMFFAQDGEFLYCGESNKPDRRRDEHAADKHWWQWVDETKTEVRWFDAEADALWAERWVVENFHPTHNEQMNKATPWRHRDHRAINIPKMPGRERRKLAATPKAQVVVPIRQRRTVTTTQPAVRRRSA